MDQELFQKNVALLSSQTAAERHIVPGHTAPLPSVDAVERIVELVKKLVFPGFFDLRHGDSGIRSYHIGVYIEQLQQLLSKQIELALLFDDSNCQCTVHTAADDLATRLIDQLPEIKRLLLTDVRAIYEKDQSVCNYSEVIFCYPVIRAMVHYRTAHALHEMGVPILPRIITEQAHAITGIDIHPGAKIGEYFAIDHGTGVVIGETCVIGNHVTLYQGVTLGARAGSGERESRSCREVIARHPILEDRVTVYSNSTLLGRITIGHDTIIGGNVWVTHDLAPYSHILQGKAQDVGFTDGAGI
ncbi:MAG: serine acetyltransferase [Prevotella sp.]|nr:serine acetyltransferase [Prevotella sp.]